MKTVEGHELTVISEVILEFERRLEYYGDDMEPDCKEELEDAISTLNGILKKPDFAPEVKYVEVEVPVEKILNSKEIEDRLKMAERFGRESVNPNFKYCVFSTEMRDGLYVTDDFEKALSKAKSLSLSSSYGFYTVYKIRKTHDGTYKTFMEETYHDGELLTDRRGEEFLHFDYLVQVADGVVKM